MKRTAYALAATIGLLAVAQPALAGSAVLKYRDLDLSSQAGREELDRRISAAAREACGFSDAVTGTRIMPKEARECYKDARAKIEQRFPGMTETKMAGR